MGWQHRGKEKITKDFWEHIASLPVERGIMASRKSVPFYRGKIHGLYSLPPSSTTSLTDLCFMFSCFHVSDPFS